MHISSRIRVLDGIRGLAISLVMFHHFFQNFSRGETGLDAMVFGMASAGWSGVDLFFVLSGFLITGILYDSRSDPRYFWNFYGRRTLRIFPLYYLTLTVFYVVFPLVTDPRVQTYVADAAPDAGWFWAYLSNFRIAARGEWYDHLIPNVFWSLAIEEQFYLAWPLVVRVCSRRALIWVCCSLILTALLTRMGLEALGAHSILFFVLTPARMDCLAIGALLAVMARSAGGLTPMVVPARVLLVGGVIVTGMVIATTGQLEWASREMRTVGFTLVAAMFAGLLVLALTAPDDSTIRRVFESQLLRMFGKYSYAMYLFHGPANVLVKQVFDPASGPIVFGSMVPAVGAYALATATLTLAIAWTSWHVFEKHFMTLQRHFRPATPVVPPELLAAGGHQGVPPTSPPQV